MRFRMQLATQDALIEIEGIAMHSSTQPERASSFELKMRTSKEKWQGSSSWLGAVGDVLAACLSLRRRGGGFRRHDAG